MEVLNQLALELYENKSDYKEQDYISIMNILMDNYNKLKGNPIVERNSKSKFEEEEEENEDEDDYEYGDSYLGDGYLNSY